MTSINIGEFGFGKCRHIQLSLNLLNVNIYLYFYLYGENICVSLFFRGGRGGGRKGGR